MDETAQIAHIAGLARWFEKPDGAIAIKCGTSWWKAIPSKAGVYVAYENGQVVYCGETACLQDRMQDMSDTRHHTLRRHVGKRAFSMRPDFVLASSKRRFPQDLEIELNWHMEKFSIKALPISLGRKEVEDYLVEKHNPLFNRKSRRGK